MVLQAMPQRADVYPPRAEQGRPQTADVPVVREHVGRLPDGGGGGVWRICSPAAGEHIAPAPAAIRDGNPIPVPSSARAAARGHPLPRCAGLLHCTYRPCASSANQGLLARSSRPVPPLRRHERASLCQMQSWDCSDVPQLLGARGVTV